MAPMGYHAMSIFPEYFKVDGQWLLAEESRMDCVPVYAGGAIAVKEFRLLKAGEMVFTGRTENAQDGIYVHANGFQEAAAQQEVFAFRQNVPGRRPSPKITMRSTACSAMSGSTAKSSGSWARLLPSTMTPAAPLPSW